MVRTPATQRLALAFAALLVGAGRATAMDSCAGTVAASLLGTLPRPLVVGIDVPDNSPRNLKLAGRFGEGLHAAGIAVAPAASAVAGAASAVLELNASLSSGAADAGAGSFSDFSDFNMGGVQRDYPDAGQIGGGRVGPQVLTLRVDLRPKAAQRVIWVASIQCTVQTSDTAQLAYDMGTVIGPLIGRRSDRVRF